MDCPLVMDLGYGDFSGAFHKKASEQRIPVNGTIEVTMRCNLRCKHCYQPLSHRTAHTPNELTLPEFQRIFSEITDAGCLWLLMTGGEPFLRPDFLDIYDDAKRKGLIITLFTNGTMLTPSIVDHLDEWRPFLVEISLYGATAETYEAVTGIPGSYKRCMQGIELLQEKKIPLKLKSVLLTINRHEIDDMQRLSSQLGLEFFYDPVINGAINGEKYPLQYRLSPEEIVAIEAKDERRAKAWPETYETWRDVKINTRKMYTCGGGRTGFHIDAFGQMSLCLVAREPHYDLRAGSFKNCWEEFFTEVINREYEHDIECIHCRLRAVCAQCPGFAWTEAMNFEQKSEFICKLAHLRSETFDKSDV